MAEKNNGAAGKVGSALPELKSYFFESFQQGGDVKKEKKSSDADSTSSL